MIKVRNNYSGSKSIDIDIDKNVSINLRNEQYDELIDALELSMAEKVIESDNYQVSAEKRSRKCREFISEIRDVFYEDFGQTFLKRDLKEINLQRLDEVLEKYSLLLGFE